MRLDGVHELPIFLGVPRAEVEALIKGADQQRHRHGSYLFREGQPADFFGYVISGCYKLSLTDLNGDEVIMHIGVRGEALAIMATMTARCRFPFDAVAMGDSQFLAIPRENFFQRWVTHPLVLLRYQNDLQGRIFRSHDEKRIQHRPLTERVADLLIYLADHKIGRAGHLGIPITRREIAAYVGAKVESVIRVMSGWSREGLIESSERMICIRDRFRLAERCSTRSPSAISHETRLARLWQSSSVSSNTMNCVKGINERPQLPRPGISGNSSLE